MPLLIICVGILLLLILMLYFKIDAFLSLIMVSIVIGVASGLDMETLVTSIKKGIGSILGDLVLILVFGAMLGKLVAETGAIQKISTRLTEAFGKERMVWAIVITGFIIGIPLVYTAGFVLLIPLVFTMSAIANVSPLFIGIPMAAALSVTHGFLPPHPGPTTIAGLCKADLGLTLIYGSIIAIPTIILAGPFFSRFVRTMDCKPPEVLSSTKKFSEEEMPGFGISVLCALFPVLLIALGPIPGHLSFLYPAFSVPLKVLGKPEIALLLSVVFSIYILGIRKGRKMQELMKHLSEAISGIGMILLIIAAGGAFKEVLSQSGAGEYLAEMLKGSALSPLLLAWTLTAAIRVALGSATVAGLASAGIVLPMFIGTEYSPELMVLAIGAGSLMFSHVNDAGFWIFKEYFNLSIVQTLKSWSIMETIVSVSGLAGVLILDAII